MQIDFMGAASRKMAPVWRIMNDEYAVLRPFLTCVLMTRKGRCKMMSNENTKRKDPMKGLIILTVLMAVLVAVAVVGGNLLRDYRAGLLEKKQAAVEERNEEKYAAYLKEVDAYKASMEVEKVNAAWPSAAPEGWDVVDLTNYPLEMPGTTIVNRAEIMHNGLLLINEWHSRPNDFDDESVVSVSGYARNVTELSSFWDDSTCKLFPNAIEALIAMLKDAKAVGLEHYVLMKGYTYRTFEEQQALFDAEVASIRNRHSDYSEERVIERAKQSINYPGTSEFNSGLSFRLYLYDGEDRTLGSTPFYETEQGKWLYENSWKYGIVFRFPQDGYPMADTQDKAYKTGVNSNFNFYRYVDVPHATVMHHLDLCLEEYIEYLMDHPHIAVFENGQKRYEITRQQVGDDVDPITVNINRMTDNYTMYLDNMGGVVTVYSY